jgi:hypothetical protein
MNRPATQEPANMATTKGSTLPGARERSAMAGPGQKPASPQPTPKTAAPATSGRSIRPARLDEGRGRDRRGHAQQAVESQSDDTDKHPAGHDEREARIPPAVRDGGDVEEVPDLGRIGHAGDREADAEQHAAGPGGEQGYRGALHRMCLVTKTVAIAVAMKTATATIDRSENRDRPQMP